MDNIFINLLVNFISDWIFFGTLAVFGWILVLVLRRNPLLKFFGVQNTKRIAIYLSKIPVIRGGSLGVDNKPRSYQGEAVSFQELSVANEIKDLFNYAFPSLSDKPGLLSKLLLSDVQVQLQPSPNQTSEIEHSASFISLGSPGYNIVSKHIESHLNSEAGFSSGFSAIIVEGVQPESNLSYGFVEKIVDKSTGKHVFYVAGLSELGTVGSAYYLAKEWRNLRKRYDDKKEFIVLLRFIEEDYRRWSIVFEKEVVNRRVRSSLESSTQNAESNEAHRSFARALKQSGTVTASGANLDLQTGQPLPVPSGIRDPRYFTSETVEEEQPSQIPTYKTIKRSKLDTGGTAIPSNDTDSEDEKT